MKYQGQPVCNRGFVKLLGMGTGRFQRMRTALRQGAQQCPFDARYIAKGPQPPSEAKDRVYSFLMQLYEHAAEPIPDGLNSNKRPRQGCHKRDRKGLDRSGIRHLPPGSISDYYVQCKSSNPTMTISKKLFSSAPELSNLKPFLIQRLFCTGVRVSRLCWCCIFKDLGFN